MSTKPSNAARNSPASLQARREELLLRSELLRKRMGLRSRSLRPALRATDQVAEGARWVKEHQAFVLLAGAAVLGAAIARPGAFMRLGTRAFAAWQVIQRVQPMVRTLRRYL